MLTKTFMHAPGVGKALERRLWAEGVLSWDDFMARRHRETRKTEAIRKVIGDSICALAKSDHRFFSEALPASEHWRLFKEFLGKTAYIDIETTGLSADYCQITTIALYDGRDIRHYVNGKNLDKFIGDVRKYDLIVTYNGKGFDVPVIETHFRTRLRHSHIDLRYVLASVGYSGGLKACEKAFGLSRNELEGVDGFMAVRLWREHQRGHRSALDTLLAYNIEDVVNLEPLMYSAYNLKLKKLGLAGGLPPAPPRPRTPFRADTALISRLLAPREPRFDWSVGATL
jgi:uncharacterized protein YprB with RNaseH-like and TPR domain